MLKQPEPDFVIAGAGIIGLTLALELQERGATVAVLEPSIALQQASVAAAGMLAAEDPHNPSQLAPLARFSLGLYPRLLKQLEKLGGRHVPFQTETTLQYLRDDSVIRLAERSLDPRQLSEALLIATRATSIQLEEHVGSIEVSTGESALRVRTLSGLDFRPGKFVHASGAWFRGSSSVFPRKGQMLRVRPPESFPLREVHRAEAIYIVPRTVGSQAGSAIIGATLEDAGFDIAVHPHDLRHLRELAARLLPCLASEAHAPQLEAWAGLRPATVDGLPLLGQLGDVGNQFVAAGHFRNGILLAPATAEVMADLLEEKTPKVDLAAFAPSRFRTV